VGVRRGILAAFFHDVEGHALTLGQSVQAGALHRAYVYKYILAATLRLDKAVALGGIEKFNGSSRHSALQIYQFAARNSGAERTIQSSWVSRNSVPE